MVDDPERRDKYGEIIADERLKQDQKKVCAVLLPEDASFLTVLKQSGLHSEISSQSHIAVHAGRGLLDH